MREVIKRLLFFGWLLLPFAAVGQVDSLLTVVKNPANDTSDINALYKLAIHYVRSDRELSLSYAHRMSLLADERGDWKWGALGYRTVGVIHWLAGQQDSSIHYYEIAMDRIVDPARAPKVGTGLLINLGTYSQVNYAYDDAVRYYSEAYELMRSSGYDKDMGKVLNNLGAVYRQLTRWNSAQRAYERSLELKIIDKDSAGIATTLSNLGKVKLERGDLDGAEKDLDEAKEIYTLIGMPEEVPSVDLLKGVALFVRDDHEQALQTIMSALDDPALKPTAKMLADALFIVAEIYRQEGDFEQALRFLKQGEPMADRVGIKKIASNYDRAFGRVYRGLGELENSAAFFANYAEVIDTVIERERLSTQAESAAFFQAKLREAEIQRQDLVIAQQRQGQQLLWLGLACLALLTTGLFLLLRSRQKIQRSEALRVEIERKAEVYALKQEAEVQGLRSMIEGQEAERKRVAKDLHDGLGGLLATVKARLTTEASAAKESSKLIDRACTEVRRIAHNMMPQTLALSGLSGSVQDIVAQLNQRGLDTEIELMGQPDLRLDEESQAMLLRILQELTHNVVKHAQAEKLFIQLLDQPTQLLLTVEDDGVGFNADYMRENGGGIGLANIQSRVSYLKGNLQYDSSPGHGTTVTLTIPL